MGRARGLCAAEKERVEMAESRPGENREQGESPEETAARLIAQAREGALGTKLAGDPGGAPYVSLVLLGRDEAPGPLLLLSDLADHSNNLKADPSASLLLREAAGKGDPLAQARVTLQGKVERLPQSARAAAKEAFLARHPTAALYADFGDFAFYRLKIEKLHLVAGFGRIHWIEAGALPL
jgi:putative heme iron utilization protein